jgi:hypothetical protein
MDELTLTYGITLRHPADLPFADRMHRLVTLNRSPSTFRRSEPETCRNSLLDEAVVLLDHVIQIRGRSTTTAPTKFAGLFEFVDRAGVRRMPSTLITRGGGPPADNARRRNNFAAIRSRLGDNRNSVSPQNRWHDKDTPKSPQLSPRFHRRAKSDWDAASRSEFADAKQAHSAGPNARS